MITYNKILATGLLMTSSVVAMADGTFSLSPIVLAEGETRTVTVSLSNEEKIQNIDLTIQLPAGLEFVKNTFVKGSRLSQDVAAAAVAGDQSKYRIISVNLDADSPLFEPGEGEILSFDVIAKPGFVASGDIEIETAKLIKPDASTETVVVTDGKIATAKAGKQVIAAEDLNISFDGSAVEKAITLNAGETTDPIKVFLESKNSAENNVSLVQGTIVLPDGVHYVTGSGTVSDRAAGGILAPMKSFIEKTVDGKTVLEFKVGRLGGALQGTEGELFSFKLKADGTDAYTSLTPEITISDIVVTVPSGSEGLQSFPEEVITVKVTNANEIAKVGEDGTGTTAGTDFDTTTLNANLQAKKDEVAASTVFDNAAVKQSITDAQEAIDTYTTKVAEYHTAGTLATNKAEIDGLRDAAQALIDAITADGSAYKNALGVAATNQQNAETAWASQANVPDADIKNTDAILAAQQTLQEKKDALAQYDGENNLIAGALFDAIQAGQLADNDFATEIQAVNDAITAVNDAITAARTTADTKKGEVEAKVAELANVPDADIKNTDAVLAAQQTLQEKKDALAKYDEENNLIAGALFDAIQAGELADADFTAAKQDVTDAITAVNNAITAARTTADTKKGEVEAKVAELANVPADNIRNAAAILAAQQTLQEKKDALAKYDEENNLIAGALFDAIQAGELADADFTAAMQDVTDAITAVNDAITAATIAANANNAAATKAMTEVDPENGGYALPANIKEDDTDGTWNTAKEALEGAVAAAATDGKQADENIYATEIAALKTALETVAGKADANNALVTAVAAEYKKYKYQNDLYDGTPIDLNGMSYVNVKKNAAVKAAVADYKAAYQAVLNKQTDAATAGTQAKDDIYKTELDAFYAAEQALQDAIKAATDQAKLNQDAVNEALGKTVENPVGTGKNDAYDNIKGSDAVIDKETALADAKQALQDALATAKTSGTLGENPNKLNGAINAVNEKLTALQNELNTQSEIAAANYDIKEAAAAAAADFSAVKAENLTDVNDAQIVKDAKAAFETAQNAVANKYQEMLDANKAGDPVETAALVILNAALDEALQAYNDAIATANSAIENLNQMSQTVDDVMDEVVGEIANAKVKQITADSNDFGIDNTAEFAQLMNKLLQMYADKVDEIAQLKQDFLAGTKDAIDVAYALDKLTNEEKFTYTEEAVQMLVEFLTKYQRGDVDGDGEFTIGDYLAVRKYLINNNAPKADAAQDDHQQRYDFARADVNQDGAVDVADARGAMNVAFYGKVNGEGAAEARANVAESLVATMNGNRIAIALNNARQYCNMQLDLVMTEGMTVVGQELSARMGKHTVSGSDLGNGIYRIVITSSDIEGAIEGNEGDLLYINVEGQGNVEFQNVILADMAAGSHKFQIAGVAGGETTGIAAAKQNGVMESIYNMGGRVMNGLKKGINIIRRADGTTQKVIKK